MVNSHVTCEYCFPTEIMHLESRFHIDGYEDIHMQGFHHLKSIFFVHGKHTLNRKTLHMNVFVPV